MHHSSPLALWHSEVIGSPIDLDVDLAFYGVDPDGPVPNIETDNIVIVPESTIQLTEEQANEINQLVPDHYDDDGNHGINHYQTVRNYLQTQF